IPIRLADKTIVESIAILFASNDLILYDVGTGNLHSVHTGAQMLRHVQGRLRWFSFTGTALGTGFSATPALQLVGADKPELPAEVVFRSYERLTDGARLHRQAQFPSGVVEYTETLRLVTDAGRRRLHRELRFTGIPAGRSLEVRQRASEAAVELVRVT